jgi:hypothetical protein
VFEAAMDQCCEIISRQLVRLEGLMHHRPEALSGDQALPEPIRSARTTLGTTRVRRDVLMRETRSRCRACT